MTHPFVDATQGLLASRTGVDVRHFAPKVIRSSGPGDGCWYQPGVLPEKPCEIHCTLWWSSESQSLACHDQGRPYPCTNNNNPPPWFPPGQNQAGPAQDPLYQESVVKFVQ